MLDGNVKVQENAVAIYAHGQQPNVKLPDEYILVLNNGGAKSRTYPLGCFTGNLMIVLNCKMFEDGTVKANRIAKLISQLEGLINDKAYKEYFFTLDTANPITPTTQNYSTGYSTTILNVEWRSTEI